MKVMNVIQAQQTVSELFVMMAHVVIQQDQALAQVMEAFEPGYVSKSMII